jgi:hypothetical protein
MNLVERAKKIILEPSKEWDVIKAENITITDMFTQYAAVLAAIPAVAGFIGSTIIGYHSFGYSFRVPLGRGLAGAIMTYALSLAGVYLYGFIIDILAPTFGSKKDMNSSLKVSVFSFTAGWVASALSIIPMLSVLALLAGLYNFYLLYLGLKKVKEAPQEKLIGYLVVSVVIGIVISYIIMAIAGVITMGSLAGFGRFGGMGGY